MEIYEMTALEIAQKIKNKEITAVDAVESVAKAVESKDKTYNCYASFDKDAALQQAEIVQKRIDSGSPPVRQKFFTTSSRRMMLRLSTD